MALRAALAGATGAAAPKKATFAAAAPIAAVRDGPRARIDRTLSGLRKSAKRFSARNPLSLFRIDHVYDFGLVQSKIIVI
ncbi:MAG: hypothetical protein P4L73_20025 [Caulobacteraceae bacterium]|nr:hypothetical protein [Caulobacteraceae bacterium]